MRKTTISDLAYWLNVTKPEEKVLKLLSEKPYSTRDDVQQFLSCTTRWAHNLLSSLWRENLISRTADKRWFITDETAKKLLANPYAMTPLFSN